MKIRYGMSVLALAIATAALTGCEPYEDPAATAADEADIDSQTRGALAAEQEELKNELAKAREKDPTIKDMYYGVDENGVKVLHIVREVPKEGGGTESANTVLPFVTGMLLGQMLSNNAMMANSYMHNTRRYSHEEERRRRNTVYSGYTSYKRSSVSRSFVSSRPTSVYSTRASGAFSGGSSARAGGYSSGG